MCRSLLRGSSPKCFQNLTEEMLFAFLFALSIHRLWAVMVLLQHLDPGSQSVHDTILMAQGQKRSEHKQKSSSRSRGPPGPPALSTVSCSIESKVTGVLQQNQHLLHCLVVSNFGVEKHHHSQLQNRIELDGAHRLVFVGVPADFLRPTYWCQGCAT